MQGEQRDCDPQEDVEDCLAKVESQQSEVRPTANCGFGGAGVVNVCGVQHRPLLTNAEPRILSYQISSFAFRFDHGSSLSPRLRCRGFLALVLS